MSNNARSLGERVLRFKDGEEMKAFDRLPAGLRQRLANAPLPWSAVMVEKVITGKLPLWGVDPKVEKILGLKEFVGWHGSESSSKAAT